MNKNYNLEEIINKSKKELQELCRSNDYKVTGNKQKLRNYLTSEEDGRTKRNNNSKNETERIKYIITKFKKLLSEKDPLLIKALEFVNINYNDIKCFEKMGGRKYHYDIQILFKDGNTINIEHKSNNKHDKNHPWSTQPQLLNGTCKMFTLSKDYCYFWYKKLPEIKEKLKMESEIPSYKEFSDKDATTGPPKTKFGLELKNLRKNKEIRKYLDNLVKKSTYNFLKNISDSDMSEFTKQLESIMKKILNEKHLWLDVSYDSSSSIKFKKYHFGKTPQLYNLSAHIELNENNKKLPIIKLKYNLTSEPDKIFYGEARLRWGNQNGIANIRWNIK